MFDIKHIQDSIAESEKALEGFVAEGLTDKANEMAGRIAAYREQYAAAVDALQRENEAIKAKPAVKAEAKTFGQRILGEKVSNFMLREGFRATAVRDAITGLTTPQKYDTDLMAPYGVISGFLSTIPTGVAEGDEHFFTPGAMTNNAASWTSGNKPESNIEWTPAVAHLDTVAHHMPIQKLVANRYNELEQVVSGSLLIGLDMVADAMVISGNNASGIVGITNTVGINTHTNVAAKNLLDNIRMMRTAVRKATGGVSPTHVAMSSAAFDEICMLKGTDGHYLFPGLAETGRILGMQVVLDENFEGTKQGCLVYNPNGAKFKVADPKEVTVGLVGNQFIQNAYTLLAEETALFRVDQPKYFCYCADMGL